MAVRRALAVLIIAGFVFTSITIRNLAVPFADRARLQERLTGVADRGAWWPDFPAFLQDVRAHTSPGDTIALGIPTSNPQMYEYAYYRASYFLSGRDVLPLAPPHGRPDITSLQRARYLAAWNTTVRTRSPIVFRGHRGVLVAR